MIEPAPAAVSLPSTAQAAVRSVTAQLAAAGIVDAGRDARILVAEAIGVDIRALIVSPEMPVSPAAAARLAAMVARRAAREPVSRILGQRAFYGRSFAITPATLDPRPDSETLIEAALEVADQQGWRTRPIRILDVGTGSGCLLLTLLAELPLARGVGTDISGAALAVAAGNAEALGLSARATFRLQHLLDGCDTFDLMVSNPPYIAATEIARLDPEVRDFDPHLALDGGADGLAVYRALAPRIATTVPAGWAMLEVGAGQAADVVGLLRAAATDEARRQPAIRLWQDLDGRDRCVAISPHR